MKKILLLVSGFLYMSSYAQDIRMEFPYLKGKAYDFIIFQGTGAKTVIQDTIPQDGKFTLRIPAEFAPYTGMSRWLITGTQEGGGLDMLIPGHDFSVSCREAKPDDGNIIYTGNQEIPELNTLYKTQQSIFEKHDAMLQATKAFPKNERNYPVFEKEYQNQLKAYDGFQHELTKKGDYPSKFMNIVNITQGIGTSIFEKEEDKAKNIAQYIKEKLDWQTVYTSGHWDGVIASWVAIHSQVLSDAKNFASDFAEISKKIKDPVHYADFAKSVASALTQSGKDNFTAVIAPMVVASNKIQSYDGALAVYVSVSQGSQAPDLTLTENGNTTVLKSKGFSTKEYHKTLLLFYRSDCGACEALLQELLGKYEKLKEAGVRVISLSADEDLTVFKNKAKDFPWKGVYYDGKGLKGFNFKNYGVVGTPTLFLIDKDGKIDLRTAALGDIFDHLKK
jgi:thiol-disulfide isomerase/thioredoxin